MKVICSKFSHTRLAKTETFDLHEEKLLPVSLQAFLMHMTLMGFLTGLLIIHVLLKWPSLIMQCLGDPTTYWE